MSINYMLFAENVAVWFLYEEADSGFSISPVLLYLMLACYKSQPCRCSAFSCSTEDYLAAKITDGGCLHNEPSILMASRWYLLVGEEDACSTSWIVAPCSQFPCFLIKSKR